MVDRSSLALALLALVMVGGLLGVDTAVAQSDLAQVEEHLRARSIELGLEAGDFDDLVVTSSYRTAHNGVTHLYLRQQVGGIEVANSTTGIHFDSEGKVLAFGDRLVRGVRGKVDSLRAVISQVEAIEAAADELGLVTRAPIELVEHIGGTADETIYGAADLSLEPIPVKLALYETSSGAVRLAWELVIRQTDRQHWWNLWIDAETGALIEKSDWIANDSYEVFAVPKESPTDGPRTIEMDPADPTGSPFGWHDTDGAAGAEFTDTRGNNVSAQEDVDDNDSGGSRPDGGATLDFSFPIDLATQAPPAYQDAAIVNLFYWNNILHDILYEYGFDEPAGNFQENNYGNGGADGDPVQADAQDGSGLNNANFGTPPDGFDPRMQMFIWVGPQELEVNFPPAIAGIYDAAPAAFGLLLDPTGVTGNLELVDDGTGLPTEGCNALVGFTVGRVAVIDRGSCEFGVKVLNAENAGASAAIVINNDGDDLITMGAGAVGNQVTIGAVFIGQTDGTAIKGDLPANATMRSTELARDSDLDNGIIAHEYGHGVSNRLTGGPATTNCLLGLEQAGEGWSDIMTLFFSGDPADTPVTPHGVGTYVIFEDADGGGIRAAPYTTDFAVNGFTYGDIQTAGADGDPLSVPHGVGFVWATAAWEVYWNLVTEHGFDPDLYEGTGGNNLWFQLIIDGLKLQPCIPSMVEARDAILAADLANNGGVNECAIWHGFARRGLGENANSGAIDTDLVVNEDFTVPAECTNDEAPDVDIVTPDDATIVDTLDTIDFTGYGYDIEDGDLTASLAWTSDLDGSIGAGGTPSTTLTPGYHMVTAAVTDSGALSGDDSIVVVVTDGVGCPATKTVDTTISGVETHAAVDTLTLGSSLLVESSGDLTGTAGVLVEFLNGVTIEGALAVGTDPQPCPV